MIQAAIWRRIALILEVISIAWVVVAIVSLGWLTLQYRPSPDAIDDLGPGLAWVFIGPLVPIAVVGTIGLVRWWLSGHDTPIIAYNVLAILVVAPFIPASLAIGDEVEADPRAAVLMIAPIAFVAVTGLASLAVYRSRGVRSGASQLT